MIVYSINIVHFKEISMSSTSRRRRWISFAKLLVFSGLVFLFVTNKKIGLLGHIKDFYTLPDTDPRVQQMGTGIFVILAGFIIWIAMTMIVAGSMPKKTSTWAWLFWMVIFGLIFAQICFPAISWIYARL